jgi:hypothetical protein
MKRNITIAITVAVSLTVGFTVSHLTAPRRPASLPIDVTQPVAPPRIEPDMPTHVEAPVARPLPAQPAPAQKYWYGPNRDEVGAGIEAELKRQREHPETPSGSNLKPLNVK